MSYSPDRRSSADALARATMPGRVTSDGSVLLAIVGATGTGKSALAIDLATDLARCGTSVEIVNGDAMQLYRGMDIGTAKVSLAERRGIPHHLLDVLEITDEAAVADYQSRARHVISGIRETGALPILVGGSGLYVSSVLWDFRFPGRDPRIRERLECELASDGVAALHRRLTEVDRAAADAIGPHNGRRLVRALEVIELTGEPFGAGLPGDDELWTPTSIIGLRRERADLVAALDERVERMWREGLLDEVSSLLPEGLKSSVTAGRAIGYAQAIAQLDGESTEREAIESTQALTRRYARRQVGWFRRYRDATWFDAADPALASKVLTSLGDAQ